MGFFFSCFSATPEIEEASDRTKRTRYELLKQVQLSDLKLNPVETNKPTPCDTQPCKFVLHRKKSTPKKKKRKKKKVAAVKSKSDERND
jgi:hypothetical protein